MRNIKKLQKFDMSKLSTFYPRQTKNNEQNFTLAKLLFTRILVLDDIRTMALIYFSELISKGALVLQTNREELANIVEFSNLDISSIGIQNTIDRLALKQIKAECSLSEPIVQTTISKLTELDKERTASLRLFTFSQQKTSSTEQSKIVLPTFSVHETFSLGSTTFSTQSKKDRNYFLFPASNDKKPSGNTPYYNYPTQPQANNTGIFEQSDEIVKYINSRTLSTEMMNNIFEKLITQDKISIVISGEMNKEDSYSSCLSTYSYRKLYISDLLHFQTLPQSETPERLSVLSEKKFTLPGQKNNWNRLASDNRFFLLEPSMYIYKIMETVLLDPEKYMLLDKAFKENLLSRVYCYYNEVMSCLQKLFQLFNSPILQNNNSTPNYNTIYITNLNTVFYTTDKPLQQIIRTVKSLQNRPELFSLSANNSSRLLALTKLAIEINSKVEDTVNQTLDILNTMQDTFDKIRVLEEL